MPIRQINYTAESFKSTPNLIFIGLMLFLTLVFNYGFLFLLLAGELGVLMLSQLGPIQQMLRNKAELEWRRQQEEAEFRIIGSFSEYYKADFHKVKTLCEEIERRAGDLGENKTSSLMTEGLVDKLSSFRLEYVKMLRAHFLLANRNYKEMQRRIEAECKRAEDAMELEQSPQVRATMGQNLKILRQRSAKLRQLDELVRLIEARLQVVRNSLQLIQDEVYSLTNVRGISDMVDNLLVNLELSDEFRSYYDDVLSEQSPMLTGLEISGDGMSLEPDFKPEPPEELNKPRRQRRAQ